MSGSPIVILTNERDLAVDDVIRRLAERHVAIVRVNIEEVAASSIQPWSLKRPSFQPGVVWWRQFELPREDNSDVQAVDDLLVVRAQWRSWLACLYDSAIPWINDLWAARRAENKIEQLRMADSIGFAVPDTVVTNDLGQALHLGDESSLVVKTVAAAYFEFTDEGFVYTRSLRDDAFRDSKLWHRQPLIVQRRMDGLDVRVVMVEERCFGAACKTDLVDWRLAGRVARWRPWPVPEQVAQRCRAYMAGSGLRYAAFDFIDDGHDVWFLEANQAGEWIFLDRSLSLEISEALASSLFKLATVR